MVLSIYVLTSRPPRFILFLIQMYCTWETYFPSICPMCSGSRKCGPWSNSMRTTRELVRKARSWGPFQTYWIRPSGGGASNLGFKKPPRWPWCTLKFENHCSSGNWCGKGPAYYEEAVIHLWKQAPREQQQPQMPECNLAVLQSAASRGVMTGVQESHQLGLASFVVENRLLDPSLLSANMEGLELF